MRKTKSWPHSTLSIERTTKSCRGKPLWLRLKRKKRRLNSPSKSGFVKSKLRPRSMKKTKYRPLSTLSIERITKSCRGRLLLPRWKMRKRHLNSKKSRGCGK